MLAVSKIDAAAIRRVFSEDGSAVIELRRRFRGISDNTKVGECGWIIPGWRPSEAVPSTVTVAASLTT